MRQKLPALCLLLALLSLIGPALADPQDNIQTLEANPIPRRDPIDLATRLGDLDPSTLAYDPRPIYALGDQEDFILAAGPGQEGGVFRAELAGAAEGVYLWIEVGIPYDPAQAQKMAQIMSEQIMPTMRATFGTETPTPSDSRIYVFSVRDAGPGIAGFYNDTDRYPDELFATSNEVNSVVMGLDPQNVPDYLSTLAHEFQHLVQAFQDDSEETWFVEGVAELGSRLAYPEGFGSQRMTAYLNGGTHLQLNTWAGPGENPGLYYGGASLFFAYAAQVHGQSWIPLAAQEPADGVLGLNLAFQAAALSDPLTGEGVTFDSIFADFVAANALNNPGLADGRYGYSFVPVSDRANPIYRIDQFPAQISDAVLPYGTHYIELSSPQDTPLTLSFSGGESVPLVPTEAHSGEYFMWSQRGNQGNAALTGRFDLRGLSAATLEFWTWYQIEEAWDYGYLSLSADGGQTWNVLQHPVMETANPYDRAFAPGLTGVSGGGVARPAAYLGVGFGAGLQIETVQAGSPAAEAGLQVGDELLAINEQALTTANIFRVIDQYQPGQGILLALRRGGEVLSLNLIFGEHPSRTVPPPPQWVQLRFDLSPYAGQEVLIRFDYVTDQAASYEGWLIDDLAIPELGLFDDFETPQTYWDSAGWVRISNSIPQDYLLQILDPQAGTVTRLMRPGDANSGAWDVELKGGQGLILAVSGIAADTYQAGPYQLNLSPR